MGQQRETVSPVWATHADSEPQSDAPLQRSYTATVGQPTPSIVVQIAPDAVEKHPAAPSQYRRRHVVPVAQLPVAGHAAQVARRPQLVDAPQLTTLQQSKSLQSTYPSPSFEHPSEQAATVFSGPGAHTGIASRGIATSTGDGSESCGGATSTGGSESCDVATSTGGEPESCGVTSAGGGPESSCIGVSTGGGPESYALTSTPLSSEDAQAQGVNCVPSPAQTCAPERPSVHRHATVALGVHDREVLEGEHPTLASAATTIHATETWRGRPLIIAYPLTQRLPVLQSNAIGAHGCWLDRHATGPIDASRPRRAPSEGRASSGRRRSVRS